MGEYRKKPVVIEAFCWDSERAGLNIQIWASKHGKTLWLENDGEKAISISIPTLEGTMRADPGDWIIRGIKGEFYPCKPDIFEVTYEPASQD